MTDRRMEEPAAEANPVPRDLPDQQAGGTVGGDPWEPKDRKKDDADDEREEREEGGDESDDAADPDQAGSGRRGAPHTGSVHPEQVVPDEPSG